MPHLKGSEGAYNSCTCMSVLYYPNTNCAAVRIKNFLTRKVLEACQKPHAYLGYDCSSEL